ncbi:MAG: M20 family metallopeptidase [Clostridiales bacterium]|nr:M20 family metallopeptidase [Clostridiales bacterium]
MEIRQIAKRYKGYVIDLRREFHMHPEPSLKELNTSQRIKSELRKLNIPYTPAADTGVIAEIKGKKHGKTVALRADIDALEINEANDIEYKSQNPGLMHACGHDAHIASLLGAARILNDVRDNISGTIRLLFQPAEEIGKGAKALIAAGAMDGVDGVFGIHVSSNLECGKVSVDGGPLMACADVFKITIKGKSGHGARPHQAIDALVAACAAVINLQTIISREIDPLEPAVISVGSIKSGTRFNIIANDAVLEGTSRCFGEKTRKQIFAAIERVIKYTAQAYRAEVGIEYNFTTSPLINDARCSEIGAGAVKKILSAKALAHVGRSLGTDDFSEYLKKSPGIYALVGVGNKTKGIIYPYHHERFNIDEDSLEISSALYAQYALDFLESSL